MALRILGIESSCDETGAAVIIDGRLQANLVAGQEVHSRYGGVVPELASRAHQSAIVPVVDQALKEAGIHVSDLDGIAYTRGPGLLGALMVGASYAKGLSLVHGIPLIPVHHMQAHILAHFIDAPMPAFPFLCLTVSGGHTQIVLVRDYFQMEILGQTLDDAAGEAFDKAAKMLGLQYPGGPEIDRLASTGDPERFRFAEPAVAGLDFSFSGLKTSILYFLRDAVKDEPDFIERNLPDLCASIQQTIIHLLTKRMRQASNETGIREIALAGGVSANSGLRNLMQESAQSHNWNLYIPPISYCTDNAAMIAITGYLALQRGGAGELKDSPMARMDFITLPG